MSESEKKFLLRSAGHVLGPFSKEEVISLIKRGKISVFDEVTEPFAIWRYLQDHQDFKETVQSMDFHSRLTNFITQISGKISKAARTGDTASQTEGGMETLTDTGPKFDLNPEEKNKAQEASFEFSKEEKKQAPSAARYQSQEESEEAIRKKASLAVKISWRLVTALALSALAYVFYKEAFVPAQKERAVEQSLKAQGLRFYQAGGYKQALPYFEKAYERNILEEREKLWLASLFLQENKWQKAQALLDRLSDSPMANSGKGLLLKGMLSFFQEDFPSASAYFNSALEREQTLALINLSLLKWKAGDYKKSLFYLDRLMEAGYERGIALYLRALNLRASAQSAALSSYIRRKLSLEEGAGLAKEYRQELYLLLADSLLAEQKPEELKRAIKNLLNEDPFFAGEARQYSSFIAVKSLSWADIYPYCRRIFESDPEDSLLSALHGFCHLKAGHFKRGASNIERAKNREPGHPLFLSLYGYLLLLEGKNPQAEQALSLIDYDSLKPGQFLPFILKARLYEERQDWARALSAWKSLLSLSSKHLSGTAGAAVASHRLGDSSTATAYKGMALRDYPYYVRLLSLTPGQ